MISKCFRSLLANRGKTTMSQFCTVSREEQRIRLGLGFGGMTAVVTGAGKGIGRLLCLQLANEGANVIAISRTREDLKSLKKIYPKKIQFQRIDISEWETIKTAIYYMGPVDLLVNNAGLTDPELLKELGEISEEEVDRIFDTNVKAMVNVTQEIAKGMKIRGKGAIVNISCVIGERGAPHSSVYCASKGAVNQLTRAMAVEYGPYGIRVNSVNPTTVRSAMTEKAGMFDPKNETANALKLRTPLERFAEPEDVTGPVLFLLSEYADMITGANVPVDGGISVSLL